MSNELELYEKQELTFDGKRVRTSKEQLSMALAPMFVAFSGLKMDDETLNAYHMMLADLDPNKLAVAVVKACQAHEYPTHLITVAAIRKAYDEEQRAPGPEGGIPAEERKFVPTKMYRLDPEADKRERMERLRRTKGWNYA
jgi:hypothetical protein